MSVMYNMGDIGRVEVSVPAWSPLVAVVPRAGFTAWPGSDVSGAIALFVVVVPLAVFTTTVLTPRASACSSLYQTSRKPLVVSRLAPFNTVLSLKAMLVRGLLLAYGYVCTP